MNDELIIYFRNGKEASQLSDKELRDERLFYEVVAAASEQEMLSAKENLKVLNAEGERRSEVSP